MDTVYGGPQKSGRPITVAAFPPSARRNQHWPRRTSPTSPLLEAMNSGFLGRSSSASSNAQECVREHPKSAITVVASRRGKHSSVNSRDPRKRKMSDAHTGRKHHHCLQAHYSDAYAAPFRFHNLVKELLCTIPENRRYRGNEGSSRKLVHAPTLAPHVARRNSRPARAHPAQNSHPRRAPLQAKSRTKTSSGPGR